jgi:hypothetical protein
MVRRHAQAYDRCGLEATADTSEALWGKSCRGKQ